MSKRGRPPKAAQPAPERAPRKRSAAESKLVMVQLDRDYRDRLNDLAAKHNMSLVKMTNLIVGQVLERAEVVIPEPQLKFK